MGLSRQEEYIGIALATKIKHQIKDAYKPTQARGPSPQEASSALRWRRRCSSWKSHRSINTPAFGFYAKNTAPPTNESQPLRKNRHLNKRKNLPDIFVLTKLRVKTAIRWSLISSIYENSRRYIRKKRTCTVRTDALTARRIWYSYWATKRVCEEGCSQNERNCWRRR